MIDDPLLRFSHVRASMGLRDVRALKKACEKFQIPVLKFNTSFWALRKSDYQRLLDRAAGSQTNSPSP
jgi:hypothetical protein